MSVKVHTVCNIDAIGILKRHGLNPGGRIQKYLISQCDKYMAGYLPFRGGMWLKNHYLQDDGILYVGPQGKFLYYGKVMVGVESGSAWARKGEQKRVTDRDLKYTHTTKNVLAGPFWDVRMWRDHKEDILKSVTEECTK